MKMRRDEFFFLTEYVFEQINMCNCNHFWRMVLVLRARQVEWTRGLEGNHLSNFPTLYAVKRAQTNLSLFVLGWIPMCRLQHGIFGEEINRNERQCDRTHRKDSKPIVEFIADVERYHSTGFIPVGI